MNLKHFRISFEVSVKSRLKHETIAEALEDAVTRAIDDSRSEMEGFVGPNIEIADIVDFQVEDFDK